MITKIFALKWSINSFLHEFSQSVLQPQFFSIFIRVTNQNFQYVVVWHKFFDLLLTNEDFFEQNLLFLFDDLITWKIWFDIYCRLFWLLLCNLLALSFCHHEWHFSLLKTNGAISKDHIFQEIIESSAKDFIILVIILQRVSLTVHLNGRISWFPVISYHISINFLNFTLLIEMFSYISVL